tara:strand:+ start:486 stop:884 length:399 start_codon:yes stop_codon:yes gene_type:complete
VPGPKDNICPTQHDCDGFQWAHTPSLYYTLRITEKIPEKLIPFEPKKEPDTMEFTRRILENIKKRRLLVTGSSTTSSSKVDKLPKTPRKLPQCSTQPKRTCLSQIRRRKLFNSPLAVPIKENNNSQEDAQPS